MQTIERVILTALLRDMHDAGYEPAAVWDGGDYVMAKKGKGVVSSGGGRQRIHRPLTDQEAMDAIDSVCESTLHFTHHNAKTWGNRGVLLILGNGEDVISDYHSASGERFGEIIDAIYTRITDGELV